MSKLRKFAMQKDNAVARLMIMVLASVMLIATVSMTAYAQSGYVIYDGDDRQIVISEATEPSAVLAEAGIELGRADLVEMNEEGMRPEITVRRLQLIRINNGGQSMVTCTYGCTVGELLELLNMPLNEGDAIDAELSAQTYDGMELNIDRWTTVNETYTEEIPFVTEYVEEKLMLKGDEEVRTEGVNGVLTHTAAVTYFNGQEVSREVVSSEQTVAPVNEVIAQGTLEAEKGKLTIGDGVIVTADGKVYTYDRTMKVKATAYTHTDAGCNMTTATGTTVHWGTVAVDPKLIPYGTKMFIVSNDGKYVYGLSAAEDCGGSIKGNRIDLYMPTTSECFQFGMRNCTIYFLS
ncbi:MAG: G5 domain-containing protein [Oscillospiraceae bacterium]|nr:G5 domain-containing protein [Oscillospiraceae bacterium]